MRPGVLPPVPYRDVREVVPNGAPPVRSSRDNETREALCLRRANREGRSTSASTKAVGS